MKIEFKQIILAILTGIACGFIIIFVVPTQYELLVWLILIALIGRLCNKFYSDKVLLKTFDKDPDGNQLILYYAGKNRLNPLGE